MVFEYLSFEEHPEALAVGVFIIVFAVTGYLFGKMIKNRGAAMIISLAVSAIASWQLYRERFYGWEGTLAALLYITITLLFLKILFAFFRKRSHY